MRWRGLRRSENVRDVRGAGRAGMGLPLPIGRGGGLITIGILILVALIGGPDALNYLLGGGAPIGDSPTGARLNDEDSDFVAAILGSTEDVWTSLLAQRRIAYTPPELTLFDGAVDSACGYASAAVGPFYCPSDRRVYLDTSFFDELARLGGPGDFAQAYVIGHEVGHHVQTLLGTSAEVRSRQAQVGETDANRLQVAMELQADCYAGVWAYHANQSQQVLEPGDVEEGLRAAAAIGDDTLQRNAGRRVTPDSFTHGSSAARQKWLETGLESGRIEECNTFGG
ncbi:MAG TPA: neutral zinc metallopeptidase [Gammaproteobacteria bacterium]|nr:neutral zinc metallopeptidase [Gammaproteobacteria bacterium]